MSNMQDPGAEPTIPPAQTAEVDAFKALLHKPFKDDQKGQIDIWIGDLAEEVLKTTPIVSDDSLAKIDAMIAGIDGMLTAQINAIMHHPDFQQLEGAWRGLHHLVNNTDQGEMLKIRVFSISKKELHGTLKKFKGARWDQSPLFKKIYDEELGTPGGKPYGCLVGDFHFDHSHQDVETLEEVAKIAAVSHCPFICGAGPSVCGLESWQELSGPDALSQIFELDEYAKWRSLRVSEDSRYIGLAMPRFLARLPYGASTVPVDDFSFEEDTSAGDHSKYTWANSAYAMAVNINRAFTAYEWCTMIRGPESGGVVEGLHCHTFPTDDGRVETKCPTEIAITKRRENELASLGFMPLQHVKTTDTGVFVGAQSLQKPGKFTDADATANANLAARLPYLFACSRFAHYVEAMVWKKIGSLKSRSQIETWLKNWIIDYVCDTNTSSEEQKAQRPLAGAEVVVRDVEGDPGSYRATVSLIPHYQVEKMTIAMSLVSKLPSEKRQV